MSQQGQTSPCPPPPRGDVERGWIYHRNREQPTPDPNEPPLKQIQFYLDRYRIKEALQIFFEESTLRLLGDESDFMWDVIPIITRRLRGLCQYRFRVFEGCEKMLCHIAVDENCNPKEVLIGLLAEISQCDQSVDDNVFRAMIRPLEGTLLRMSYPSPRDENFRWVLQVLMRHIGSIELPQEYDLEGKKRAALTSDQNVKRFIEVLPLLLSFIEEFNNQPVDFDKSPMPLLTESQIDEVLNGELFDGELLNEDSQSRCDSLDASVTALLSLMFKPLSFLDLTTQSNELRLIGHRCLITLLKLKPNVFSPIYKRICDNLKMVDSDSVNSTGLCEESVISLATCSYLYRNEQLVQLELPHYFPQVITHEYKLLSNLPYIVGLLKQTEVFAHEKGLLLVESLLKLIEHNTLDKKFLAFLEASELCNHLFGIMVFSPLCTNRRKAYDTFTSLCDLLDYECKYQVFKSVLAECDQRACIRAACIDQYRKHLTNLYLELLQLNHQFDSDSTASPDSTVCLETVQRVKQVHLKYNIIGGQALLDFLDLCVKACLFGSQHTDIIENYELILATLTLLRFLKLRKAIFKDDLEEDYLSGKKLNRTFFEPVRSAIALLVGELKDLHKVIVEGFEKNPTISQASLLDGTLAEGELEILSRIIGPKLGEFVDTKGQEFCRQDESDCLSWALCKLDLLESILVRTCDPYNC